MRLCRIALALPPLLLASLSAGCDSPAGLDTSEVVGQYALESLDGIPIPGPTLSNPSITFYVLGDTLRLLPDGLGERASVTRTDYVDPGKQDQLSTTHLTFSYRVRGERVEVTYSCPPDANCLPGPHAIGRVEDGALVVRGSESSARYRRVAP